MNRQIKKTCTKCKIEKQAGEFYIRNKTIGDLAPHCKQCHRTQRDSSRPRLNPPVRNAQEQVINALKQSINPMSATDIQKATGLSYYMARKTSLELVISYQLEIEKHNAKKGGATHLFSLAKQQQNKKRTPKVHPLLIQLHKSFFIARTA